MIELKYANKDKSLDNGGWILDVDVINEIHEKLLSLSNDTLYTDRETIEAILLIANGEKCLLEERLIELEDF